MTTPSTPEPTPGRPRPDHDLPGRPGRPDRPDHELPDTDNPPKPEHPIADPKPDRPTPKRGN